MKKLITIYLSVIVFTSLLNAKVSVEFNDVENYRDIQLDVTNSEKLQEIVLREVRESFEKTGSKYLPEDYELKITVFDIDLAGDFELPSLMGKNVRVLTDTFPPRIKFRYEIIDHENNVLRNDEESLVDLNYLFSIRPFNRPHAEFVSELVKNWGRKILRKTLQ